MSLIDDRLIQNDGELQVIELSYHPISQVLLIENEISIESTPGPSRYCNIFIILK